ncbi:CHASE2 and HATPase_c domain-containing protein [Bacteriovoracaceae bacterium]|nr:CHASE2 and HATPase_c domain-containing protein [Bacteriovoracaceae bacterium]
MNLSKFKILNSLKKIEYSNLYPLFFTLIFILILLQYSFHSLDAIFYDLWVRNDVGIQEDSEVVLILMDEETDQFLGEIYPYSYATHVKFIQKLVADEPGIVSFITPLSEPDNEIEQKYLNEFKSYLVKYVEEGGYYRFGTNADIWGEQLPTLDLKDLGHSLALVNVDNVSFARDDVSRRAILNISGEDTLHLVLSNVYKRKIGEKEKIATAYNGAYYNKDADATFTLFRYSSSTTEFDTAMKTIPYHRVMVGNFPSGYFKDKIVLIGPKYFSNSDDFVKTPFNKRDETSSKLIVHGNIIDSLIKNKSVFQVPKIVSDLISIFVAIFLSFIISRVQPTRGLLFTVGLMFSILVLSYLLFITFGYWIKLSHIILSIFVVYYIWVPFRAIAEYQTRYAIQEESKLIKKVDNLKQNFISLMSHDLKTPVAKIAGIADLLKVQFNNTSEQKNLIDSIILSTKELNNFITSILDLTKIESRNLNLKKENRDVNQFVEATVKKYQFEIQQKNIHIDSELSPIYPISVDVNLINRVISNIVENAIKYTPEGSKIEIKTWDDQDWVYISIKDNGPGIDQDNLEHIFEKFYRVKNDLSHTVKGSGLGLYLVKYFVELHEGQIIADSIVGEGTNFTIQLPNR